MVYLSYSRRRPVGVDELMVMLDVGINRIRTLFNNDIFKCQAGSGTNDPLPTDTGLQTAIATTLLTPTKTTADKAVQVTHAINSAIA